MKKEIEQDKRPDLIINRVPKQQLRLFKIISKEEFNGDYGITIKQLVDYYINDVKYMSLLDRVLQMDERLSIMESTRQDIKDMDTPELMNGERLTEGDEQ